MPFEPPAGYVDCDDDADKAPPNTGPFKEIDVPGVGVIHARRPLPNAIPALSSAANPKVSDQSRLDYLDLFVLNHLAPGEFEDILVRMTDPDTDLPPDSMLRVSRAIATAGTARPT